MLFKNVTCRYLNECVACRVLRRFDVLKENESPLSLIFRKNAICNELFVTRRSFLSPFSCWTSQEEVVNHRTLSMSMDVTDFKRFRFVHENTKTRNELYIKSIGQYICMYV